MMRLIDADSVKRGIEELKQSPWYNEKNLSYFSIRKEAVEVVEHLCIDKEPTVDSKPVKHGHWIFGETMGHSWMKCSECCVSQSGQTATFTYCPSCGAKMDGGENG